MGDIGKEAYKILHGMIHPLKYPSDVEDVPDLRRSLQRDSLSRGSSLNVPDLCACHVSLLKHKAWRLSCKQR